MPCQVPPADAHQAKLLLLCEVVYQGVASAPGNWHTLLALSGSWPILYNSLKYKRHREFRDVVVHGSNLPPGI